MTSPHRIVLKRARGAVLLGISFPTLFSAALSAQTATRATALSASIVSAAPALTSAATVSAVSGASSRIMEKIDDRKRTTLAGHVRPFLRLATDEGAVSDGTATMPMMLIFSRTAAQQSTLDALADNLHNSNSPQFHQWLTPQQFAASFSRLTLTSPR